MATIILTCFQAQQLPLRPSTGFRRLNRWLTLKAPGKEGKKPEITWSEWQDLNLQPLRPERLSRTENH
jgi:hypothetical protein